MHIVYVYEQERLHTLQRHVINQETYFFVYFIHKYGYDKYDSAAELIAGKYAINCRDGMCVPRRSSASSNG